MEIKDLIAKIKKLEIKTKHLTKQVLSGEYHSAFKGRGMTFSEVRNYQMGDEIRTIDWNVTARFNEPYVKVFEEERELQIFLLIDISESSKYGLMEKSKLEILLEVAATIAFSAEANRDKVGAMLYTDQVEKFIPLSNGRNHNLYIIREIIEYPAKGKGTSLATACEKAMRLLKKKAIVFVISDFIDDSATNALQQMRKKHEVVAIKIEDPVEYDFPDLGLIRMLNKETGEEEWVNTATADFKAQYRQQKVDENEAWQTGLTKMGIDATTISTTDESHRSLVELFHKRMRQR